MNLPIINKDDFKTILQNDFGTFVEKCFRELNPSTQFIPNWHLDLMALRLEDCRAGNNNKFIINIPPRYMKSITVTVAFTAWLLGHDPSTKIICLSYGKELSDKHSRDFITIVTSDWYQSLFPKMKIARQTIDEVTTTSQGFRMSTSVGGVLTGRGADYLIIDDPIKPEEAISDTQRKGVNDWYSHTLISRLDSKEKSRIIIVMQRLHQDDLTGYVTQKENYGVLSLPAIAEQDETHRITNIYGSYTKIRKTGEPLHPERESLEIIQNIKASLGEYNFAGQYQQSPVPKGGGMVKEEWFKPYEPHQLPEGFDLIVQSWDTANKENEFSDYSVCVTFGIKDKKIYLLNVFRKRLDYPNLKRAVMEQHQAFKSTVILIEDKASGTQLIQELKYAGIYQVKGYKPEGDKKMRMHAQTGMFENGFVYLPKEAHWLGEYTSEITTFPYGRYDDQADATSQALCWIKQSDYAPGVGYLRFYEEEAKRINGNNMPPETVNRITYLPDGGIIKY